MKYLMIEDIARLRSKMSRGQVPLDRWWPHFLQLARHHSTTFPLFPSLAYLVTEDEEYAAIARDRILEHTRKLLPYEYSLHVQFHTWCNAQPLARTAIAFDWVADSDVFSAEEFAEISEAFIAYAYKHPYMVAQSRTERAADNQIMSMCFACAVIGFLFGVKRGNDPRARELFAYGVFRFPNMVGHCDPGGYSHEGSTYMDQIVMPSSALFAAFMESTLGEDFLEQRYPPNQTCLREALEMDAKMISPGGIMPPWDHYGYQRAMNKCGIAYLARKTGNYSWLALIMQLEMWAEDDQIAWGSDDKLWTLLWWPDDAVIPEGVNPFPSWVVENTAAALDAPGNQLRLFQYWDQCGKDYHCGRPQVNPNAIVLEAYGSPFLMDGTPNDNCTHFAYPLQKVAPYMTDELMQQTLQLFKEIGSEKTVESWLKGWTYGCIGGSNSIIVDEQPWYAPREEKSGCALAFAASAPLKAITSDAVDYYQPTYDLTEMRRTAMLVRDSYVMVRDRIAAATPHHWSWQAFTRPGVTALPHGFRIATPEMTQCDIIPAGSYQQSVQQVVDYTFTLEGDAGLIQFSQHGTDASFGVCLSPSLSLELITDLSQGWRAGIADTAAPGDIWQRVPQQGKPVALADMAYFAADAPLRTWRWLQQTVIRPAGERIILRIDKAVPSTKVFVNGEELPLVSLGMKKFNDRLTPLVVDTTDALQPGENLLVLAARPSIGKTFAGKAGLYREIAPMAAPRVEEVSPGCYLVEHHNNRDLLLVDSPGDFSGEGWKTDAWCALLDAREGAVLNASYCMSEHFSFLGTKTDLSWTSSMLDCGDLSGTAEICCRWPGGQVQIESSGTLRISGTPGISLCWTSQVAKPVLANGQLLQPERDPMRPHYRIHIPSAESTHAGGTQARWQSAITLAWTPGEEARQTLLTLLHDDWWTVRCAAALSLGTRRESSSVDALVAAMRVDMARDNYPPMAQDADAEDLFNKPEDLSTREAQEHFVKRWRFLMCCAIALGEIGDAAAVPVLCELLQRKIDFYPAQANACHALGKIGDAAALPTLHLFANAFESNTSRRAKEAIEKIESAVLREQS